MRLRKGVATQTWTPSLLASAQCDGAARSSHAAVACHSGYGMLRDARPATRRDIRCIPSDVVASIRPTQSPDRLCSFSCAPCTKCSPRLKDEEGLRKGAVAFARSMHVTRTQQPQL